MELFIQITQLILCLSILVILHEAGHFFAAKFFKTKVEKFYLFFNPWFSLFKKKIGETEYGIGWLPLGGYVKIAGMIDESMDTEQMKKPAQPWEFRSKPAWQRLIIMLAGIVVNIILSIVIYSILSMTVGEIITDATKIKNGYMFSEEGKKLGFQNGDNILRIDGKADLNPNNLPLDILFGDNVTVSREGKEVTFDLAAKAKKDVIKNDGKSFMSIAFPVEVDSVMDNSIASKYLKKGDLIQAVNNDETKYFIEFRNKITQYKNDSVTLSILRGNEIVKEKVYIPDSAVIGFYPAINFTDIVSQKKYGLFDGIKKGAEKSWDVLVLQIRQFKLLLNTETEAYKGVMGPLRMYKIFEPNWDWVRFWNFTALFSVWLAFINLIPIPGLDGGHSLFTIAEMITGRKLSDKAMEKVQMVGVFIILGITILVFGNDLWHIFYNFFK